MRVQAGVDAAHGATPAATARPPADPGGAPLLVQPPAPAPAAGRTGSDSDDPSRAIEEGRRLGHDVYRYSAWLPRSDWPASVLEGWREAALRQPRRARADRYMRKWLQLRLGPLARGLRVDDGVTLALLREIDVERCPVTREVLTHGMGARTDWSVDRLDNQGAYLVWNLAVMSRHANRAKGDRGFAQVQALAAASRPAHGPQPVHWQRLAALMLGPSFAHRPQQAPLLPLLVPIPPRTVSSGAQLVQQFFTRCCARPASRNALVKLLRPCMPDERARWRLERLADAVHDSLKPVAVACDAWMDPRPMAALADWRASLPERHWAAVCALVAASSGARRIDVPAPSRWQGRGT